MSLEERINDQLASDYLFINSDQAVLRILILEDLRSDAELMQLHLRKLGMEKQVEVATHRPDFENKFLTFRPHIVLSDYSLPQYTGMEALQFVQSHNRFIPFIICTGSMNEATAVACIKAGADDYVLKDAMGRLSSAVENALRAKTNLIEKERAVSELKKSEDNFRALAENAPDHLFKIDRNGRIGYVNRSVDGIDREAAVGTSIYAYIKEEDHPQLQNAIYEAYDNAEQVTTEIEGIAKDGIARWYLCRIGPVLSNEIVDSLVFIPSDITERIRAERELNLLNEKLQSLTRHLEKVRDEEKEKIAMEIHDQLGQELTGTKLGLFWLKQVIQTDDSAAINVAAAVDKIDYLVDLTTTTIQTVRRIAHELRPVVLDNMGLIAALEWHVSNHNKTSEVPCSLHIDIGDLRFVKEFNTAIYRITQEALTNINRHAEASQSWVDFVIDDHELVLQIRDNGRGLDPEAALQSKSLGLFGMRERVRSWGGDFKLSSTLGRGSIIRIAFNEDRMALFQLPVNE